MATSATLQYVLSTDMPSEHKAVLIELLTQALRDDETKRVLQRSALATVSRSWDEAETRCLTDLLAGKIAKSWQNADELLMNAATQLRRTPADVRVKATELGLAASIDFSVAKAHGRTAL